ncbi:hypothetical protein [Flavobacterium subsaxonicum]|uniref:VCBS repeat-containing protein n=1 Tax=Flavobacterium subsaxonicum WB 4.1-42 = DSM 21790 TaxID=1121898 RepID=A0A0A2MRN8_9FLAO|nr:hypothetical protein [Flavobacterium subsaxonicum]KGO94226.1 hypothetical protein Q766_04690 [Flavobacterium subsaxonicum WB 4.1-42 = DSM 21790]
MATKITLLLVLAFTTFCASGQDKIPDGYRLAPTLSITGDFNGDGKPDTLAQFVTDSLGKPLKYIVEAGTYEEDIILYSKLGYQNTFTLNGNVANVDNHVALGLYCLINIGDLNDDKRDEIALVPVLLDFSMLNTCRIYSYCKNSWTQMFSFGINESSFDYEGDTEPLFTNIPQSLEKRNGKWVYIDYCKWMEMDDPKMMLLKVPKCK